MTKVVAYGRTTPIRVAVYAVDPLTATGVGSLLAQTSQCKVLPRSRTDEADVVVVCDSSVTASLMEMIRELISRTAPRIILVLDRSWPDTLPAASQWGISTVLVRPELGPAKLRRAIQSVIESTVEDAPRVRGHADLSTLEALSAPALNSHGLSSREIEILRLLANGSGIRDIGAKLSYSERTVTNILNSMTARLDLRNRTQAVAYALRTGAI